MPPKNSRKKPGSEGAKAGCRWKKLTAPSSSRAHGAPAGDANPEEGEDDASKALAQVVWDKYPVHTEHLLDFLDAHADIALKLFGDSTKLAKSEGQSKVTAKSNKAAAYMLLADAIFSVDNDPLIWSDVASNPNKYVKAVNNYITNTWVIMFSYLIWI